MIIDAIRALYDKAPEKPKGNPTGSRFGRCCAQSQLLRYPEISKPTPFPVRSRMMFEEGDRIEAWWSEKINEAFPNKSGLAQEPFYFPVPIDTADVDRVRTAISLRDNLPGLARLWGTEVPAFRPPSIEWKRRWAWPPGMPSFSTMRA